MIVVTGTGRSGTSLVAHLYRELGFDPGGWWMSEVNAGLEHHDVWQLNTALARAIGVSPGERRGSRIVDAVGTAVRRSEGHVSPRVRGPFVRVVDAARYRRDRPDLIRWERLPAVAMQYAEDLRGAADAHVVAKDPQFCFTLGAWLAAGAKVDAVVLTIRSLDAVVESRMRAGMFSGRARSWAMHNYSYGIGLLMAATTEHRVPMETLRFPDFLDDPEALYRVLPLPEPRSEAEFERAFASVRDPSLVHDGR